MENNSLEFLDLLTIISFAIQMQNTVALSKQATNNDVINDIHQDIERLDHKLDLIIQHLGIISS